MTERNHSPQLSKPQAKKILEAAAADSSRVHFSEHAFFRMEEREITATQVLRILGTGQITEGPVWSVPHGSWELTVRGFDSGAVVTLPVAIEQDQTGVIIVTVF
ncbi:MAG: DUF4258 domain-containing protein [Candidatus Nitronauta litoralis]|uniref:DUF4258 domain-containing protein n=1 Tax=Candidatus Nitronauta litoralis TaxID=2705533 RepID=A0A7T0BV03_9BACT|nr:MAG: DUF4258 domain-containing protein [Candidatus Nitronauta litoralis]